MKHITALLILALSMVAAAVESRIGTAEKSTT